MLGELDNKFAVITGAGRGLLGGQARRDRHQQGNRPGKSGKIQKYRLRDAIVGAS